MKKVTFLTPTELSSIVGGKKRFEDSTGPDTPTTDETTTATKTMADRDGDGKLG